MQTSYLRSRRQSLYIGIPLLTAAVTAFLLFYIDEGAYNICWIYDLGSWFVFSIYTTILLMTQVMIQLLFFRKYSGWTKHLVVAATGIPLGIALSVGLFWLWMHVN